MERGESFESKRNSFIPWADAPRVYVRASTLCCFHSGVSIRSFRSCAEIKMKYPFDGVASFNRVWRTVPESDAESVDPTAMCHCE